MTSLKTAVTGTDNEQTIHELLLQAGVQKTRKMAGFVPDLVAEEDDVQLSFFVYPSRKDINRLSDIFDDPDCHWVSITIVDRGVRSHRAVEVDTISVPHIYIKDDNIPF